MKLLIAIVCCGTALILCSVLPNLATISQDRLFFSGLCLLVATIIGYTGYVFIKYLDGGYE